MAVLWTSDLATGVDEIDNQHKELFFRINQLFFASGTAKSKEEVVRLIDFLGEYVVSHFNTEETYMVMHHYPDYEFHKAQHTAFLNEFSDLKKRYQEEGATSHLVIVLQQRVFDWLRKHICKVDKVLGAFLKTKM